MIQKWPSINNKSHGYNWVCMSMLNLHTFKKHRIKHHQETEAETYCIMYRDNMCMKAAAACKHTCSKKQIWSVHWVRWAPQSFQKLRSWMSVRQHCGCVSIWVTGGEISDEWRQTHLLVSGHGLFLSTLQWNQRQFSCESSAKHSALATQVAKFIFSVHAHRYWLNQTKTSRGNHNDDCCFNVNVPFDIDFHFLLQHSILSRNRL